MGFLEKYQSQPIGVGTRFYIADRLESTVIEVVEGEAAGDEGVWSAGDAGTPPVDRGTRSPGWQQLRKPEEGDTNNNRNPNPAKRPKVQEMPEAGAAAGSVPSSWPSGTAGCVPSSTPPEVGRVPPSSAPGAASPASAAIGMHQAPFSLMRVRCVGRYRAVQGGTWWYMAVQGRKGPLSGAVEGQPVSLVSYAGLCPAPATHTCAAFLSLILSFFARRVCPASATRADPCILSLIIPPILARRGLPSSSNAGCLGAWLRDLAVEGPIKMALIRQEEKVCVFAPCPLSLLFLRRDRLRLMY